MFKENIALQYSSVDRFVLNKYTPSIQAERGMGIF
jgi:hypothetical protein